MNFTFTIPAILMHPPTAGPRCATIISYKAQIVWVTGLSRRELELTAGYPPEV